MERRQFTKEFKPEDACSDGLRRSKNVRRSASTEVTKATFPRGAGERD